MIFDHVNQLVVENSNILIYVIDFETYEILFINPYGKELFGNIIGKKCYLALQNNIDYPCPFCPINDKSAREQSFQWEHYNTKIHRYYLYNHQITKCINDRLVRVSMGIDITQQKKLEYEVEEKTNALLNTFKTLSDATIETLLIYDEHKKCIYANNPSYDTLGYSQEEMIGKDALDFIAPSSKEFVRNVIVKADQPPYEALMIRKDGSTFPAILRGKDMLLNKKPIRVSAVLDISELKAKEQELLYQATHDLLTALPNRAYLTEILPNVIEETQRYHTYKALLFIDLDNFKSINDTQGHSIGDIVLKQTAQRLLSIVRSSDNVFRLGGDEFVVLCDTKSIEEESASQNAYILAEHIRQSVHQPYTIGFNIFTLTASIGIMLFCNRQYTSVQLLQYADSAMYQAKVAGKNTICFFNPIIQSKIEAKVTFLEELRFALTNDQMELFYQTQTTLTCENTPCIYGAEALIRWHHPHIGTVAPNRFIPLAEESGLIIPLGHWILEHAMRQLKAWENDPDKHTWRLSINISTKQFEHESFLPSVCALLKRIACDPRKICFELTESLLIQDAKKALRKIFELKRLDILLSIDDFGTGFSSLSYLRRLKVDELKIDKSFVRRMLSSPVDRTIIETILTLGKRFNLAIVAEGIETQAQFQALKNLGCRSFQGYLFHKPCSVASIGSF